MDPQKLCQNCQAPLADDAPHGLCPACLMKVALATATGAGQEKPGFTPPGIAELARKFPQLEIIELIGCGGMGAVYKARQKELDRIVALKILPPGVGNDDAFAERFTREAKALARLNHPGIITIHDSGQADGLYFFLMEFVDGVNLRQLLATGRVSPREALAIVPQICDALQFAHDQCIVHRDIKPENILLDRRGRVKVADFGLAKLVGERASLTDAGRVMGTPAYMAPEQARHPDDVDHRADIYALGVVFYQMLTGELPGKRIEPPSKKVHIDVRLDEVVLRALEKKPELRYQQVSEVKTSLEAFVPAATPVELKLKWPSPGKRIVFCFDMKQAIEDFGSGQPPYPLKYDIAIGFEYAFTVLKEVPEGGREVELELLEARIGTMAGGMTWQYDSAKKSSADPSSHSMVAATFGIIVGAKVRYFLDASHRIERMEGVDELMKQLKPAVPLAQPSNPSDPFVWVRNMFSNIFTETYFKRLAKLDRLLPPTAVQPGDSWTVLDAYPIEETRGDFKVVFQSWEMRADRPCARLEFQGVGKGTVKNNPETTLNTGSGMVLREGKWVEAGARVSNSILEGTTSGVAWFDPELGLTHETNAINDFKMVKTISAVPTENPDTAGPAIHMPQKLHQVITVKLVSAG